MDTAKFVKAMQRLKHHQAVTLRLSDMVGVGKIKALCQKYADVEVDRNLMIIINAILASGDWGDDRNRFYRVTGLSTVSVAELAMLSLNVESMRVDRHEAVGLMDEGVAGAQAARKLSSAILSSSFQAEMQGRNITIDSSFGLVDELPIVAFSANRANKLVLMVCVDGWSGRIAVGSTFTDEIYAKPEQVQNILRSLAM